VEQRAWLKHYDPGVPATLSPYPDRTFLDVLAVTASQRPDHPAMLFHGNVLSYSMLDQFSNALAASLIAHGVKKGDRVVLLLPNCPQFIIGQFAIWKAGAINTPLNPLYSESELEHSFKESGAEVAIVMTAYYKKVKSLQNKTKLRLIIATNIKEYLPPFGRFLFTLAKEKKDGHRTDIEQGDIWFQKALKTGASLTPPDVNVQPSDPALLLFSGGTTGLPKGAIGTHQGMVMSGMQLNAWFGVVLKNWDDIIVQLLPLFHVYGNVGVLATALTGHNPVVLIPNPRDLNDVIAVIKKVKPAFLPGVPTLFVNLLKHPKVRAGKVDFKSMKLCISGAAR
jgi:long-chain acyl-CoA synthetase